MTYKPGWHFLQVPGPTNVPQRVLRAIDMPTIDHRGPEFQTLTRTVIAGLKELFQAGHGEVVIYSASGSGAWEAAIRNTLHPGDRVLMFETGQFSSLWARIALRCDVTVDYVEGDWRHPVDAVLVSEKLALDREHRIKAVMVVHNETSTGVISDIAAIRAAIDAQGHPALLMVDTVSSLGSTEYRHDDWGVDVTVAGSQKGLMLPPGLAFNAISQKVAAHSKSFADRAGYFSWQEHLEANRNGFFPQTPATNMLFGLRESIQLLKEEGLQNVFARHARHAEATRRAARAWNIELQCLDEAAYSPSLTAMRVPEGFDADKLRSLILERFNLSLGTGLGKLQGVVFRLGHLGDFNDLMLAASLAGIQMGLQLYDVPLQGDGVAAALEYLKL